MKIRFVSKRFRDSSYSAIQTSIYLHCLMFCFCSGCFVLNGCKESEFKPGEFVYQSNFFEYSSTDIGKTLYNVRATKIVACCTKVKSKDVFDDYFARKIEVAKKTKIPAELAQYKNTQEFLLVPHADAPSGVIDGGTYVANDEEQCVNHMRAMEKKGYVQVKEIGSECSTLSKQ
ncbi:MAG: hypothetical protein ACXVCP_08375 [Bdellovibrio sp.]